MAGDTTSAVAARIQQELRTQDRPRVDAQVHESAAVTLTDVAVDFGSVHAVRRVTFPLVKNRVTALVGPSGCGKTTVLRAINRMHDRSGGSVSGSIRLGDTEIYGREARPELIRSRIGMVFQRPNPFPTMSIFDNVVSGLKFNGIRKKQVLEESAEHALKSAALWESVKDRLDQPAVRLSGGQQQRLCIARALAVEPEVLLMDEPCSALDPVSTSAIEETIVELASEVTIALVTHNMFEATRCADLTAVFLLDEADQVGELVEYGVTAQIFSSPTDPRTQLYVTGQVS
ncbi:MAG TPA: phosphate ABC transporter ATP-binding protein [Acidimicrobiales bacterium]